jgi:hypothetical protein
MKFLSKKKALLRFPTLSGSWIIPIMVAAVRGTVKQKGMMDCATLGISWFRGEAPKKQEIPPEGGTPNLTDYGLGPG